MIPRVLPRIPFSPRRNKHCSQPIGIAKTPTQPSHPFQTPVVGFHQVLDQLISGELAGAEVNNVQGLPEALFPDSAFDVEVKTIFAAMADESPSLYNRTTGRWQGCPTTDSSSQEGPIASWLQSICDRACEIYEREGGEVDENVRVWSAEFCNKAMPGGYMDRKPDIVGLFQNLPRVWKHAGVDLQIKSNAKDLKAMTQQLHDGGFNCLSTQDNRLYHIGLGLAGDNLYIYYYDRAGCLRSSAINIHSQPEEFLRVLLGLTLLNLRYLGYDPTIEIEGDKRFVTVEGVKYQLIVRLDDHPSIRGLGTVCWLCVRVSDGDGKSDRFVIKSYWVDQSRIYTEAQLLKHAKKNGVKGLPTIVAYEHVLLDGKPISTNRFREQVAAGKEVRAEERVLTRLVMKERGVPLSHFSSKVELLSGLRDSVQAHLDLFERAGIVHGDIHDKNVLLNADEVWPSRLRKGLLIDLNYAFFLRRLEDELSRTAAIGLKSCPAPFMACDLLTKPENVRHQPHHDLESFLYVLMWIGFCYSGPGGQVRTDRAFDTTSKIGKWIVGQDLETLGAIKKSHMQLDPSDSDTFMNFLNDNFTEYFDDLKICVCELRAVVMRLEPRGTHQEFIDILNKHIADLSPVIPQAQPVEVAPERSTKAGEDVRARTANVQPVTVASEQKVVVDARVSSLFNTRDPSANVDEQEEKRGKPGFYEHDLRFGESERDQEGSDTRTSLNSAVLTRKRRASVYASTGSTNQSGCPNCGMVAPENKPGSIKCTSPSCMVPVYHIGCVSQAQLQGNYSQWLCERCCNDYRRLAKKLRKEDSTRLQANCQICKKFVREADLDIISCAAPDCNELKLHLACVPQNQLESVIGQWFCDSCLDDDTPLAYTIKSCKSGPGRRSLCRVCKTIVIEAAPETIRCTAPDCKVLIFHRACVPAYQLAGDLSQWMCDDCDDDRPLGKKLQDE